ncbi:MAG: polyprenyl synthetase family protein [Clostridia bacterium]|nr:polyprenyl synthetase family protein [Clostridia bacterium]
MKEALFAELRRVAELTEKEMKRVLRLNNADRSGYEVLAEAMEYSVFAGGKRIRPYLCVEMCKAFGGNEECAVGYAAALELMQTASLIHDDLPAMDNDDFRRGKPSNHKAFGEYTAILAGDALIIHSFYAAANNPFCSMQKNAEAVVFLAQGTGVDGMCGGQQLDLHIEGQPCDGERLKKTHMLKTVALMRAAVNMGCVAADATEEQRRLAVSFAEDLGLAFQIKDDVLDAVSTVEELGKTPGKDAAVGKNTYVSLYGLEKAKDLAKEYSDRAAATAKKIGGESGQRLLALCEYLLERNN